MSDLTKGTIHIYFAGGYKDGVIESYNDPGIILRFPVDLDTVHVYQLQRIAQPAEQPPAMRGKQATYVFTGVEYTLEEDN